MTSGNVALHCLFDIYHDLNNHNDQILSLITSRYIFLITPEYKTLSEETYFLSNELARLLWMDEI